MDHIIKCTCLMFCVALSHYAEGQTVEGQTVEGQTADCFSQELPAQITEWTETPLPVTVQWGFGEFTCETLNECFGLNFTSDVELDAQIPPVQIQQGQKVKFVASKKLDSLFILPYRVDKEGYENCEISNGTAIIAAKTDEEFTVNEQFLRPGSNYFIAETFDPLYTCQFGLRLNVTVKSKECTGVGETASCWNHGRCTAHTWEPTYTCSCCPEYSGTHCDNRDACLEEPCQMNATCLDLHNDPAGLTHRCICPAGYMGPTCEQRASNMCDTVPCVNEGTCEGNKTEYVCHCEDGFTGHHCEINSNDCSSSPCSYGICVDKVDGYQCYCKPGFYGDKCDKQYNECASNPCENAGFCIDEEDSFSCHCFRGYTGERCSLKVDLCNPTECENAEDCIDRGSEFSCTCNPGYFGNHCEMNINECESNPCQNGGKCFDEVAGYVCKCAHGYTGNHCQYEIQPPSHNLVYSSTLQDQSYVTHLAIIAGVLAGALLIALAVLAGCYWTNLKQTNKGYTRQRDSRQSRSGINRRSKKRQSSVKLDPAIQQQISTVDRSGPSVDAIMEATTPGYRDNSLNAPLVASLKAKRV